MTILATRQLKCTLPSANAGSALPIETRLTTWRLHRLKEESPGATARKNDQAAFPLQGPFVAKLVSGSLRVSVSGQPNEDHVYRVGDSWQVGAGQSMTVQFDIPQRKNAILETFSY